MKTTILVLTMGLTAGAPAHDVIHIGHEGVHTAGDGHIAIRHDGHIDHLHDGHLHHMHGDHVHEHVLAVTAQNPEAEDLVSRHDHPDHAHKAGCGHPVIQHGDHLDYLHDGHLHHMHGDHVDEHGPVEIVG